MKTANLDVPSIIIGVFLRKVINDNLPSFKLPFYSRQKKNDNHEKDFIFFGRLAKIDQLYLFPSFSEDIQTPRFTFRFYNLMIRLLKDFSIESHLEYIGSNFGKQKLVSVEQLIEELENDRDNSKEVAYKIAFRALSFVLSYNKKSLTDKYIAGVEKDLDIFYACFKHEELN
jgi:hypothetical protein